MSSRTPFSRRLFALAALGIVVLTCLLYGPALDNGFVNYDDDNYITNNPFVTRGLSVEGLRWAFTSLEYASNWHPLTWLSHMLDVELFGLDPARHHQMGIALHAANAVLLLGALRALGLQRLVAIFVAVAFAVHPLRVESVAWASERKDLLGGLGWMLALLAYVHYARRPSWLRMLLVTLALAFGLLAKPMLVSLPLVLLLLDRWPLERTQHTVFTRLLVEKLPLAIPVAVSCVLTVLAQGESKALRSLASLPLELRVSNAVTAIATYVQKTLVPTDLAVFYPHPAAVESLDYAPWSALVWLLALGLLFFSGFAWLRRDTRPWVATGWFWFLLALLPVIGLVQVGLQSWADRYAYLPTIGLYLLLAEGMRAWIEAAHPQRPARVLLACLGGLSLLLGWGWRTRAQIPVWHDSQSLFEHALSVTEGNWIAHTNLGLTYMSAGQDDVALEHFREAIAARPEDSLALMNAALVLLRQGQSDEAEELFRRTIAVHPEFGEAHANLGIIQARRGEYEQARASFEEAIRHRPGDVIARTNLGTLLIAQGEARAALPHLRRALQVDPRLANAAERLAWVLATTPDPKLRDGPEAVRLMEMVIEQRRDALAFGTCAVAHAAAGDFAEAIAWQEAALRIAPPALQDPYAARLALFQSGKPFVEERP